MNEVASKMRKKPLALHFDPCDLGLNFTQQAETPLRHGFPPLPEFVEASGQTIKLHPFKGISLRHSSTLSRPGNGRNGVRPNCTKFRDGILKQSENCS